MYPVSEPVVGAADQDAVTECIRSGWIGSAGEQVNEFERMWAGYCGRAHGVAVCNGTAALHVAVAALRLERGDEIIMPTFTIMSCCAAVLMAGATPVLVDADPCTWCMDVGQIEQRITPRTRAIMCVHMYGHPVDMDPLLRLPKAIGRAAGE